MRLSGRSGPEGQASLIGAGHQTAVLRSAAYGSPMAEYQDEMAGVGYYKFIEDLEKNFQEKKGRDRSRTSECHGRDHPKGFLHGKLYRRKRVCGTGEGLKRCLKESLPESTCEVPEKLPLSAGKRTRALRPPDRFSMWQEPVTL